MGYITKVSGGGSTVQVRQRVNFSVQSKFHHRSLRYKRTFLQKVIVDKIVSTVYVILKGFPVSLHIYLRCTVSK